LSDSIIFCALVFVNEAVIFHYPLLAIFVFHTVTLNFTPKKNISPNTVVQNGIVNRSEIQLRDNSKIKQVPLIGSH